MKTNDEATRDRPPTTRWPAGTLRRAGRPARRVPNLNAIAVHPSPNTARAFNSRCVVGGQTGSRRRPCRRSSFRAMVSSCPRQKKPSARRGSLSASGGDAHADGDGSTGNGGRLRCSSAHRRCRSLMTARQRLRGPSDHRTATPGSLADRLDVYTVTRLPGENPQGSILFLASVQPRKGSSHKRIRPALASGRVLRPSRTCSYS